MKPTAEEFAKAVIILGAIPFFPKDELIRQAIRRKIEQMVSTREQLDWLVSRALDVFGDWERSFGLAGLRAVFCTKYTPADGVQPTVQLPGFTAAELEAQHFMREQIENSTPRGLIVGVPEPEEPTDPELETKLKNQLRELRLRRLETAAAAIPSKDELITVERLKGLGC